MSTHSDQQLRILIVDDDEDTRDTLSLLLRIWDYEVDSACDGPTALNLAPVFQPDVVFLDIGLPGMDGYEVARRMNKQLDMKNALLVSLSGYGTDEHRRLALEAGCDLHWIKPVEPDEMHRLLRLWKNAMKRTCVRQKAKLELSLME